MSDKNYDLPGFYRDPKTGKYFRDNPAVMKNQSLEKLKKENINPSKNPEESTNYSKYSNIFQFLRAREIGLLSGVNSEREYYKMRNYKKELFNEYSLNTYEPGNIVKVNYIRGTPSFILGVWTADEMSKFESSVIANQYLGVDHRFCFHKVYSHHITDLCEGPRDTVSYIFNNPKYENCGIVRLQLQTTELPTASPLHSKTLSILPMYCCSSTTDRECTAVGSHKSVLFYNHGNERGNSFPVYKAARAHTISFNHASNLMVIGTHNGYVSCKDFRCCKNPQTLNVSLYCINESYFLEPNQVIVAGLENVLCKIDFRMNRIVTEYDGHKTSMRKSALSVANNMLCATGLDNVTRIWHLSGGSPIHEVGPQVSPDNSVKGWLFSEGIKTYLYHFEAGFRKTFLVT